tara:strand:+ start:551 stop:979 length:429 start_codon:yes stop_codon:yes gene_type:complete
MHKKILFIILILSTSAFSQNLDDGDSYIVSRIISVYDGDTFRVDIDALPEIVGKNIAIRILGIDTPEIQGKCEQEKLLAIKARDLARDYLNNAKSIHLKNLSRGKYFRLLADVFVDDFNLADALLEKGLAVKYSGKKKSSWC